MEYTFCLEIRNGMVTSGDFTDGKYRGIQTVIVVQWRGAVTDNIVAPSRRRGDPRLISGSFFVL